MQREIRIDHNSEPSCIAYSSDGKLLASAGFDGTARIWDAKTKGNYATIKAHSKPIQCICFGAEGFLYTSCLAEGLVTIWEINSQRELRSIPFKEVACLSVYSRGNLLAAAGGKEIRLFKLDE
jgi:WD40 repeat protein